MKLIDFREGPTPTEGLPLSLMAKLLQAASRWQKNATMADLRYGVAVVSGTLPSDCPIPGFALGRHPVLLFERGEQVVISLGQDRLTLGMTLMGQWRWCWNGPIDLDDRPPARDIPGWDQVLSWLATGERGASSETMCHALFGIPERASAEAAAHPRDPDDLRRCRLFLEAVPPARERLGELSRLSGTWKTYVEHWEEMNRLFNEEAPLGRLMKTHALMRQLQEIDAG